LACVKRVVFAFPLYSQLPSLHLSVCLSAQVSTLPIPAHATRQRAQVSIFHTVHHTYLILATLASSACLVSVFSASTSDSDPGPLLRWHGWTCHMYMGNIEGCTWSSAVVVVSRVRMIMSESMQLATPLSLVGATDTAIPNTYLASNRRRRNSREPPPLQKKKRKGKETKQMGTFIPRSSCCAVLCCGVAWRGARPV
jgi:hypothetical protein